MVFISISNMCGKTCSPTGGYIANPSGRTESGVRRYIKYIETLYYRRTLRNPKKSIQRNYILQHPFRDRTTVTTRSRTHTQTTNTNQNRHDGETTSLREICQSTCASAATDDCHETFYGVIPIFIFNYPSVIYEFTTANILLFIIIVFEEKAYT